MNFFKLAQVVGMISSLMMSIAAGSLADMTYGNGRIGPCVALTIGAVVMFASAVTLLAEVCRK